MKMKEIGPVIASLLPPLYPGQWSAPFNPPPPSLNISVKHFRRFFSFRMSSEVEKRSHEPDEQRDGTLKKQKTEEISQSGTEVGSEGC